MLIAWAIAGFVSMAVVFVVELVVGGGYPGGKTLETQGKTWREWEPGSKNAFKDHSRFYIITAATSGFLLATGLALPKARPEKDEA